MILRMGPPMLSLCLVLSHSAGADRPRASFPRSTTKSVCATALGRALLVSANFQKLWSRYLSRPERARFAHYLFPGGYLQAVNRLQVMIAVAPQSVVSDGAELFDFVISPGFRRLTEDGFAQLLEHLAAWRNPDDTVALLTRMQPRRLLPPPDRQAEHAANEAVPVTVEYTLRSQIRQAGMVRLGFSLPANNWAEFVANVLERNSSSQGLDTLPIYLRIFHPGQEPAFFDPDEITFIINDDVLSRDSVFQYALETVDKSGLEAVAMNRLIREIGKGSKAWLLMRNPGVIRMADILEIWRPDGGAEQFDTQIGKLPEAKIYPLRQVPIRELENTPYAVLEDGTLMPIEDY